MKSYSKSHFENPSCTTNKRVIDFSINRQCDAVNYTGDDDYCIKISLKSSNLKKFNKSQKCKSNKE